MERYRFSEQEQAMLERLRQPFAVYQFLDKRFVTLVLSDGFCRAFGYEDRAEAYYDMDHDMYRHAHPDDVMRIANAAVRFATEGGRYEEIYRTKTRSSADYRIIHAVGEQVVTETGIRLAHIWYTDEGVYSEGEDRQGTELNRALGNALHEESMVKASQYDFLTGLPSMTYFFELAEAGKERYFDKGCRPVLLYLDFSGMKFYNTKHGFSEGDRLLQDFARLLTRLFSNENCCHIGADHFAVHTQEEGLEDRLELLLRECRDLNGGKTLPVHVGVYRSVGEKIHVSVALDRAKIACDALRGRYEMAVNEYNRELSDDTEKKQYIIENLDRAIREKWIQVWYQPIVRAVSGKVCDVEALSRWIDPTMGFLSPADFIPALEDAGLIYKLDLYVLEQVLEKMTRQAAHGLYVVPHSINLSRSDFDACDIVEEICKRVDASGVSRHKISIEITESVIGSDFDFMKAQIERFQSLGFPVWMDDFGSGYSSLDVLQSVKFDLLKFDMSFMRKLDEGDSGRIILTELMIMATSLGVDTVCEGVETESQAHFLEEIGCSKLQGYYFSRPVPYEQIVEIHRKGGQIAAENPAESSYYETIGRVNLYDLEVMASMDDSAFQNAFNTLPMGILEIQKDHAQYVRSSQSYRDFMQRFFHFDVTKDRVNFDASLLGYGPALINAVKQCCESGNRAFFDLKMPDGSKVHAFMRRIGVNPVTGSTAVAVAVLSIAAPDEGASYADIARALAADYYNIYVVDLDTESFIEYSSPAGGEEMAMERRGEDFFAAVRRDAMTRIYEEDREFFLANFSKEKIVRELDAQGTYTAIYRLIDSGTPMYASLKITRMQPQGNRIIIGVSIIEAQLRQKEEEERLHQQSVVFGRIAALSGKYYAMYIVDPETGRYFEYDVTSGYGGFGFDKNGEDFFVKGRSDGEKAVYPEDLPYFLSQFTRENIMRDVREKGMYQVHYRLVINGRPRPIILKAAMVTETDGDKLIVGVNVVDNG